ncbi:MAG: alpha-amylase, partial [Anaerolineae bacterium]|nr:alpha-amylase [Anaerolineae bacterium]
MSAFTPGVLAFSRILDDAEIVVVANTDPQAGWQGQVLVDLALNPPMTTYRVLFSNRRSAADVQVGPVQHKAADMVEIHHADGGVSAGPARALPVTLWPSEVVILRRL